jgi:fatty-acyl-CoA synthase
MLVVADDNVDRQDLSASITATIGDAIAAGHLPKWATPDEIRFVEAIAKTSVGKIDKKAIRAALS